MNGNLKKEQLRYEICACFPKALACLYRMSVNKKQYQKLKNFILALIKYIFWKI